MVLAIHRNAASDIASSGEGFQVLGMTLPFNDRLIG
jgi:hypothetical protein